MELGKDFGFRYALIPEILLIQKIEMKTIDAHCHTIFQGHKSYKTF